MDSQSIYVIKGIHGELGVYPIQYSKLVLLVMWLVSALSWIWSDGWRMQSAYSLKLAGSIRAGIFVACHGLKLITFPDTVDSI